MKDAILIILFLICSFSGFAQIDSTTKTNSVLSTNSYSSKNPNQLIKPNNHTLSGIIFLTGLGIGIVSLSTSNSLQAIENGLIITGGISGIALGVFIIEEIIFHKTVKLQVSASGIGLTVNF